jgi:rubrerythrin
MMDVMKGLFASDRPTGATVRRRTPAVRQSSPIGAISGMIEEARGDLSSSIRGLFGQQTPEEAQAQQLQEIKAAYTDAVLGVGDPNTPEGLREVAKKLGNNPDPSIQMVGVRLRQQADALQEKQTIAQRTATKDKLDIATKEIDLALKNYKLQNPEKKAPTQAELLNTIAVIESNPNSTQNELIYAQRLKEAIKLANPQVPTEKFDESVQKEIGVQYAKNIPQIKRIISSAQQALDIVNRSDGIIAGGLFPELELELKKRTMNNKFLGRLLGTAESKQQVINTQLFLQTVREQVLPGLQQFGGNDSNSEKDFLIDLSSGNIQLDIETIKANLKRIINKENTHMNNLQYRVNQIKQGKTIDLDAPLVIPKVPETQTNKKPPSEMTIEEIKQELGMSE